MSPVSHTRTWGGVVTGIQSPSRVISSRPGRVLAGITVMRFMSS